MSSQSIFICFLLILCSAKDPISTLGQKGNIQQQNLRGISVRLFTQPASSCPQKTPDKGTREGNGLCQHGAPGD